MARRPNAGGRFPTFSRFGKKDHGRRLSAISVQPDECEKKVFTMRTLVLVLIGGLLAPAMLWAEGESPAAEKKAEVKADAGPEVKAKQAAQTLKALGQVLEVFGAALERKVLAEEAIAVEGVLADVVVAAPAEDAAVGMDPLERQFVQQFRPLAKSELNFVRALCRPNAEQDKHIKTASDAALKTAVKRFAEIQKKLQQGFRAGEEPQWPDPRKLMSDVLLKSVRETMSEEAAKRYEAEIEKRAAARKRAALLNLVAKLDKDLVLTAEQRGKLTETLEKNWKDSWCQQLETFMYGEAYFPAVPDAYVLPVLTEKQKQIWNGIPKQHHMIWGWAGFGFVRAVEMEDRPVEAEAKTEEPAKVEEPQADEKKVGKP